MALPRGARAAPRLGTEAVMGAHAAVRVRIAEITPGAVVGRLAHRCVHAAMESS